MQVFPDKFHMATLHEFLGACSELHSDVKIKNVLGTMIDHLALYMSSSIRNDEATPADGYQESVTVDTSELFNVFSKNAEQMIEARPEMAAEDIIAIQVLFFRLQINNIIILILWLYILRFK
jgi:vacuolar protein sorting-associated protein 35